MFSVKINNIVLFRGIKMSDLFAAPREEGIREYTPVKVYSDIQESFTTVDEWRRQSTLECWNCTLLFDTYPRFVPTGICRGDRVAVRGNFCSWNCAARWIEDHIPAKDKQAYNHFLSVAKSQFDKRACTKIVPARPRWDLKKFCGNQGLTELEYKRELLELESTYQTGIYRLKDFNSAV